MIYYQDHHIIVYNSDCRDMSELKDNSVQCCVTSPPYWGLRKYAGLPDSIFSDNHCEHQWVVTPPRRERKAGDIKNLNSKEATNEGNLGIELPATNTCQLCGAWKGQYGLEPTPELYIQHTVEILREIKRVLRKDGVMFWNIGDSYSATRWSDTPSTTGISRRCSDIVLQKQINIPPKNLCLIPFRVAIAAQEDGWWVRSVIIWNKPNPMPESVTDRPTESHEYILMLTKSSKYYWDADAVREPAQEWGTRDRSNMRNGTTDPFLKHHGLENDTNPSGRNIRSVWTFPTQPYPDAHFATFPQKLPGTCIKAASKEGDLILDPFAGSGTTLWVAKKLGRKAVGYELSEEYCKLIVGRNRQQVFNAQ